MTHALHSPIKRAWNTLTTAVRPRAWFNNEPQIETISVASEVDRVCRCDVVRLRLRGHWHFAFLNIPGEAHIPTGHIEELASWALSIARARRAGLTVWDVDTHPSGKVSIHRVEFTPGGGRMPTSPTWHFDTPPAELKVGIEEALRLQSQRTAVANAIR